jgi:hypothetical protein
MFLVMIEAGRLATENKEIPENRSDNKQFLMTN